MNRQLLTTLETPAVLIDFSRMMENIRWAQAIANRRGLALRPHVKTHKCLGIARLQLNEGAAGITASKTDEALMFINGGVKSITVAYPIVDPRKLNRLFGAAREHGTDLRLIVDSEWGLSLLSSVSRQTGARVGVFLKVDVGLHRCGLTETDPRLLQLAHGIRAVPTLRFHGLLSHAGHSYGAANAEEIQAIAAEEVRILNRVRCRLESSGIAVPEVSVGATPTVLVSESYEGITEIRPGNYVFMDRTPVRMGLVELTRIALCVLATVVSANDRFLIIDAGSKVLSSDLGAHGTGSSADYGIAFALEETEREGEAMKVVKLSEEHGFVQRGDRDLAVGSKVQLIPNHACPVVNLADELLVMGDEIWRWPVAARGCVR